jgi:Pvc16 N-terminal domain
MSTPFAVSAVTAVLQNLLFEGFVALKVGDAVGSSVKVSALPPDRVPVTGNEATNQLNVFLVQGTHNPGWRNLGLPSRDSRGDRVADPPLALDLHYLLSAYGLAELDADVLLGFAMHLLHESPVLTRGAIRDALKAVTPPALGTALVASELADQIEQLKITPQAMSTDEISKLWTAFQAPYRTSAAYLVTVVLIEGRRSARPALPVLQRNLYVLPLCQPVIDKVVAEAGEQEPIEAGTALLVLGRQLSGDTTTLLVGGVDLTAAVSDLAEERIRVVLPAALPAGVFAGAQTVQVAHPASMGTPPAPHEGAESNVGVFVLRPQVKSLAVDAAAKEVDATLHPEVRRDQRVVLLLNRLDPPAGVPADGYSLAAPPLAPSAPPPAAVRFPFNGVAAGKYLARVRVDGAESRTEMVAGQFAKPELDFP